MCIMNIAHSMTIFYKKCPNDLLTTKICRTHQNTLQCTQLDQPFMVDKLLFNILKCNFFLYRLLFNIKINISYGFYL